MVPPVGAELPPAVELGLVEGDVAAPDPELDEHAEAGAGELWLAVLLEDVLAAGPVGLEVPGEVVLLEPAVVVAGAVAQLLLPAGVPVAVVDIVLGFPKRVTGFAAFRGFRAETLPVRFAGSFTTGRCPASADEALPATSGRAEFPTAGR